MYMNLLTHSQLCCTMSQNYPYLGPAPCRGKTATPEIMAAVKRAKTYGRDTDPISNYTLYHEISEIDLDIEHINGVYNADLSKQAAQKFMTGPNKHNLPATIATAFDKWTGWLGYSKASYLTQGRQTLSPFTLKNVPAPLAYEEILKCYELSLGRSIRDNTREFYKAQIEVFQLPYVRYQVMVEVIDEDFDSDDELMANLSMKNRQIEWEPKTKQMSGAEFRKRCCTLNGVLKNGERGQLKPRAIFCPTIPFKLISTMAEKLSEFVIGILPSNALNSGSIDKQSICTKLESELTGVHKMVETVDNSKWNETQEVGLYCHTMDVMVQHSTALEGRQAFLRQFLTLLRNQFKNKRILCGKGFSLGNDYGKRKFVTVEEMRDSPIYGWAFDFWDQGTNSIGLTQGMLMGMLNIMSTLNALIASDVQEDEVSKELPGGRFVDAKKLKKVQVSDDAVCGACNNLTTRLAGLIENAKILYSDKVFMKAFCPNCSLDKAYGIEGVGWWEYNGLWYIGGFKPNPGLDMPTMLPVGKNFVVDINQSLKMIREMCTKGSIHLCMIPRAIATVCDQYTRSYHCYNASSEGPDFSRAGYLYKMPNELKSRVPIWHGGKLHNSPSTIHIDVLQAGRAAGKIDDAYYYRLMNPVNATNFTSEEKSLVTFDAGKRIYVNDFLSPNVMNTQWVRNRTALTSETGKQKLSYNQKWQGMITAVYKIYPYLKVFTQDDEIPVSVKVAQLLIAEGDKQEGDIDQAWWGPERDRLLRVAQGGRL